MVIALAEVAYNGHKPDCLCVPCMDADMRAHLTANGVDPSRFFDGNNGEKGTSERTRYATPGTRSGRGYVRLVSERQVRFITRLMAERDTTNLVRLPGSENIAGMSLTGARDLIDRLLACPVKATPVPASAPADFATDKQIAFIGKLDGERAHDVVLPEDLTTLTKRAASLAIDALMRAPYAPKAERLTTRTGTATGELEAGMYRTADGTIYKVQRAVHGSGNMYAKRLTQVEPYAKIVRGKETTVTHEFEYASGAVRTLTADMRMTLADAIEYGAIYGVCCRCAATLTDETSIERGIGPVCAGKI